MFHKTTPGLQDQDQDQDRFWSQTGLVPRPTVSDHITGNRLVTSLFRVYTPVFIRFWSVTFHLCCNVIQRTKTESWRHKEEYQRRNTGQYHQTDDDDDDDDDDNNDDDKLVQLLFCHISESTVTQWQHWSLLEDFIDCSGQFDAGLPSAYRTQFMQRRDMSTQGNVINQQPIQALVLTVNMIA